MKRIVPLLFLLAAFLVTRVLDGDTIELKGGKRIRYMGIDAPEPYERWGTLAYETNRNLVEGKLVRIKEDHPNRDFYGRTCPCLD